MSIEDILEQMAVHAEANPKHGRNCACKDFWLREGRRVVREDLTRGQRKEMAYLFRIMQDEANYQEIQDRIRKNQDAIG